MQAEGLHKIFWGKDWQNCGEQQHEPNLAKYNRFWVI